MTYLVSGPTHRVSKTEPPPLQQGKHWIVRRPAASLQARYTRQLLLLRYAFLYDTLAVGLPIARARDPLTVSERFGTVTSAYKLTNESPGMQLLFELIFADGVSTNSYNATEAVGELGPVAPSRSRRKEVRAACSLMVSCWLSGL